MIIGKLGSFTVLFVTQDPDTEELKGTPRLWVTALCDVFGHETTVALILLIHSSMFQAHN
jgi:hypothetical protein